MTEARRGRQARRQVGRRGLLQGRRAATSRATASPRRRRSSPSCSSCKALVEACLVLEEGVCDGARDRPRDDGRRRAGPAPRPLPAVLEGRPRGARHDAREARERTRRATASASRRRAILKRLVAQGRLGLKSGQGFYAYPQADEGDQADTVKLETRGDGVAIAWLANPPMNAISPEVIGDLGKVWEQVKADDEITAMVIYSLAAGRLLRRRRHQGVHADGRARAGRAS